MSTNPAPAPAMIIDVEQHLAPSSDFRALMSSRSGTAFNFDSILARHVGHPVSSAVGSSAVSLDLQESPSWKTSSGVTFSLKPDAKCKLTVAAKGGSLPVALQVDSPETTDVQLKPAAGMTYVNIDLDFEITGCVSGKGTVSGLVISGKASACETTTVSFCQPVPSDTETLDAVKLAFSTIVFPTAPDSAERMAAGSSCRMSFTGTLSAELDLSYGLSDHKLSAPGAALVRQSVKKAWEKFTPPTAELKAGATAKVCYTHTDNLGLVIVKPGDTAAQLYLVRSSKDETDESAGISAGITVTKVGLELDPARISKTAQEITGSPALGATVGKLISTESAKPVNNLETAATKKLHTFISDNSAGLSLALSQQTERTALFNFSVDLTQADLAKQSWTALLQGDIASALNIGGFTLLAGSGVADQLKRASTLQFQFFNLYKWSDQQDFFENSSAELAADGTIRILTDVGVESAVTTKQALDKMRLHFTATATKDTKADITQAEVDLNIEISEKGAPDRALILSKVLSMINSASLQPTIDEMSAYTKAHANGTLCMIALLKPSAYSQLTFSPYSNNKPPQDQSSDKMNWVVIHQASIELMGNDFLKPWTYENWAAFNSWCNTGTANAVPDRRNPGNPDAVPAAFWGNFQNRSQFARYFLLASASGLNLIEDLSTLATATDAVSSEAQWQDLLKTLTGIVKGDTNIDYAKPISAAILSLATLTGTQTSVTTAQAKDCSTFTATLTIA